jgi:hypothetical protein
MSRAVEESNRRMLRARDAMDRAYAQPLDVAALARIADTLLARGVEFTQEPTQRPYGIDCGLRDPFGNAIRIMQPAPTPQA